ncbi:hypothetical protein Arno162_43 [Pectobacterium phage Arno162]|uniref:Uncharacterized protein n=1 Tax=Pectobacterium phage Arno162 TaxID=2500577 RepID=A0A678ZX65_9CAUD|nr:hypothetical protein Arno162_43 [Pectobacterium phage Arno162]
MKGQFESGKLAMIISSINESRQNEVGKIVTLISRSDKVERFCSNGLWWNNINGNLAWVVSGDVVASHGAKGFTFKAEKHLMLIEPPDEVKEDEKELSAPAVY